MLYACLATFGCLFIGLAGLVLSLVDIERFNFGLYLALLSVVGVTVSIAFWIIAPAACGNPVWLQLFMVKYGYKFEPVQKLYRRLCGKRRRKKRRRSAKTKNKHTSRSSKVLLTLTRAREEEERSLTEALRRDTDASRDTITIPMENQSTLPDEEDEEESIEEEQDLSPLIASSLASVLAPGLSMGRRPSQNREAATIQVHALCVPPRTIGPISELPTEITSDGVGQSVEEDDDIRNPPQPEELEIEQAFQRKLQQRNHSLIPDRMVLEGYPSSPSPSVSDQDEGEIEHVYLSLAQLNEDSEGEEYEEYAREEGGAVRVIENDFARVLESHAEDDAEAGLRHLPALRNEARPSMVRTTSEFYSHPDLEDDIFAPPRSQIGALKKSKSSYDTVQYLNNIKGAEEAGDIV